MTPRAWWLFALSSGVWGVPYLFIRVARSFEHINEKGGTDT